MKKRPLLHSIRRLADAGLNSREAAEIDAIFFASSTTQTFASEEKRTEFRERWLGRYLTHFPQQAYLATSPEQRIIGYLVGSLRDPAREPLFRDLTYFEEFAPLTARYPAQLHVNVDPNHRGEGIGARLVAAFSADAAAQAVPGLHVVTARGMRNIRFYLANGFHEAGSLTSNGRELVFLAKALGP